MREEYDRATKLWTTVFGVVLMLVIQWPAFIMQRLDSPPRDGVMGWNVAAVVLGLLAPIAWMIDDLRRYRLALPWVFSFVAIGSWAVVSFFLVNR